MMIKIGKNKIIFPDSIIVLLTSILLIFCYEYTDLIFKKNSKDGFLNAKAIIDGNNCRLKEKNDECIKKLIQESTQKKNILFLGNSQLGAINNYSIGDYNFVTLLSNDNFLTTREIVIHSIWAPNASIKEFAAIRNGLIACNADPELLIIPLFLDDTREDSIRDYIKDFSEKSCSSPVQKKSNSGKFISNVDNLDKLIKENLTFLKYMQSLNTKLRTDLYRVRNFVFRIRPDSIRPIKKSSYKANIDALEKILYSRSTKELETLVYIPPLLYSKSKKKIPYSKQDYESFKESIKKICLRYNCKFYNLESEVADELWGTKLTTNINMSSSKEEIDFMHFTGKGHLKLKEAFFLILKNKYDF